MSGIKVRMAFVWRQIEKDKEMRMLERRQKKESVDVREKRGRK